MIMLSVIIASRNEIYLGKTIENILENAEGEIEIIAELDGYIPDPQLVFDERVIFVHNKESIGQRAAINHAVSIAKGEYIMKLDAHVAVAKGFDVQLAKDCEYNMTMVPTMYNLDIKTWLPKLHKITNYMYISYREGTLRSEYYEGKAKDNKQHQPKNDKEIDDIMTCMGPGWFMHKARFLELDGCDMSHEGGWGQQGIEVACKAWLSGGRLVVNKKTWFAHWFRGGGGPGFPYPISGNQINRVREYSTDLWINNKWPKQVRTFQWLVNKFNPPSWDTDLTILYYTANVIDKGIEYSVLRSLRKQGYPILSISQEPMQLGRNIVVPKERSLKNIYKTVLLGAKEATTKYVALCEDDCLYVPEHFQYRPVKSFAYNLNRWNLYLKEEMFGQRKRPVLSQCIANREDLIKCLETRVESDKEMGREDGWEYETFETKDPNMVICHNKDTSGHKIPSDVTATEIPVWGTVKYWIDKFNKRGVK